MSEIWLSPEEVSVIENKNRATFWRRFKNNIYGIYRHIDSKTGGRGGKRLQIGLSCLSKDSQNKYYEYLKPELWLSVEEISKLEGVSERAISKRLSRTYYEKTRLIPSKKGGGRGGMKRQIALSCLTSGLQGKHWEKTVSKLEDNGTQLPELSPENNGRNITQIKGDLKTTIAGIEINTSFDITVRN